MVRTEVMGQKGVVAWGGVDGRKYQVSDGARHQVRGPWKPRRESAVRWPDLKRIHVLWIGGISVGSPGRSPRGEDGVAQAPCLPSSSARLL